MRWHLWRRAPPIQNLDELYENLRKEPELTQVPYDPDAEPAPLGDVHRRGEAAHQLLNDPTLAEAFREIREDLYSEWLSCRPGETRRREELYFEANALAKVTGKLIAYRAAARIRRDSAA